MEEEVKLHENWLSLSTCTVIWALSLKGIPYRYEEECITNETPFLPYSNSLHPKFSVIVHGKSISDSSVILEYIDEKWPQNPLLPAHPLDKATARFWIRFIDDKEAAISRMFYPGGKEQEAKHESLEMLRILEEEVIGEEKFFGGEKIGMVDLAFGQFVEWLGVFEEVIGKKLLESGSFPRLEAWSRAFMAVPEIRENRADRNRMVENIKRYRVPLLQHRSSLDPNDMKNVVGCLELFRCFCELVSILGRNKKKKANKKAPPLLTVMDEVKLYGHWSSPFVYRVIWALRIKAIPYEYVEEDIHNKSPLLLHYNPIYKKVPVLVHGGRSICESTVILEYIDETWPQNPLLPLYPLDRANARFWIQFVEDMGLTTWRMFCSSGEEREKEKRQSLEMLQIVEEKAIDDGKFFGGEKIGMVDLVYGVFGYWLGVIEDLIGEKLIEVNTFPRLYARIKNFLEAPIIRENYPDRDRMVVSFKAIRERLLQSR